jgi:AraC family transcriptional regulator
MSAQYGVVLKSRSVSGFSLKETLYSKSSRVPSHDHEEAICCIALTGSCTERYRNRTRDIKPLTVDFLPATHGHSLTFPSVGVRAFSIDISARWLERSRDYSLNLTESIHSRAGVACSLVMRLYSEFQTSDSESSLAIEGLGLELLAEISRQQPSAERHRTPKWLSPVRDILHEHFAEQLRLESLADAVGVHPVHLAREFRRHFGCTIGDYVRHLRIDYASTQLLKCSKPLAEIASDAGFADQSHFCRFFKRFTHMTPNEYRRAHASR